MKKKVEQISPGIYRTRTGTLYQRVQHDGMDRLIRLPALRLSEAKAMRAANMTAYERFQQKLGPDPYAEPEPAAPDVTVADVLHFWIECGCPDKRRRKQEGAGLEWKKGLVARLLTFAWPSIDRIGLPVLERYNTHRLKTAAESRRPLKNGRTIDVELLQLKNALRWAVRHGKIEKNPLVGLEVGNFQTDDVKHCRDAMPASADELHALAALVFDWGGDVLAFQMLFEAFTGVRTSEALSCRWDAQPGQPGFIDRQGMGCIHLERKKAGINPWAKLHPALDELLKTMRDWNAGRSPWFFPRANQPTLPAWRTSLNHALKKAARRLARASGQPVRDRTSHGLRAFYCTARRSQGAGDGEIASEMGIATGAPLIVQVYGGLPPNWKDTTAGKISWMPATVPVAWAGRVKIVPLPIAVAA